MAKFTTRSSGGNRGGSTARPLTDHDEIRQWAESRGARPTCVRGTGGPGDTGMIRLDFPGFSGEESLQEISWDEWFRQFHENNLALLVQDTTAGGEQSNFNKLVNRDQAAREAAAGARRGGGGGGRRAAGGKRAAATKKSAATRRGAAAGKASRSSAAARTSAKRSTSGARRGAAKSRAGGSKSKSRAASSKSRGGVGRGKRR